MTPAIGMTLAVIAALLWAPMAVADEAPDADADGVSKLRLLPVPIFITEPSIGQGLGASLMLIHPRSRDRTALAHVEMPDVEIEVRTGPMAAAVAGVLRGRRVPPLSEPLYRLTEVAHANGCLSSEPSCSAQAARRRASRRPRTAR